MLTHQKNFPDSRITPNVSSAWKPASAYRIDSWHLHILIWTVAKYATYLRGSICAGEARISQRRFARCGQNAAGASRNSGKNANLSKTYRLSKRRSLSYLIQQRAPATAPATRWGGAALTNRLQSWVLKKECCWIASIKAKTGSGCSGH